MTIPRRAATVPPPIPPRRGRTADGPRPSTSSPNITMPLDQADIIAALEDTDEEQTPPPGPAPVAPGPSTR